MANQTLLTAVQPDDQTVDEALVRTVSQKVYQLWLRDLQRERAQRQPTKRRKKQQR